MEHSKDKTGAFCQITDQMTNTYRRKNKDYGDSFAGELRDGNWGYATGTLRAKANRVHHLLLHTADHTPEIGESVEDNLMDLANYAIMTLIEFREAKERRNNLKAEDNGGRGEEEEEAQEETPKKSNP